MKGLLQMKRFFLNYFTVLFFVVALSACSSAAGQDQADSTTEEIQQSQAALEDGIYQAVFKTDSSMFHINEAYDDKGTLTVQDGKMSIHITLVSKNVTNLYLGLAKDAKEDETNVIQPTTDSVTYSDGYTEQVYGFDLPVPALDEEFDVALLGKKGKWYDHKVVVSDPSPQEEGQTDSAKEQLSLEDGSYSMEAALDGGSGRASIESPLKVKIEEQKATATLVWSSEYYDYMIVGDEKYLPVNTEGNSTFEIPVEDLSEPLDVIADTTAMSTPHEIDYVITFQVDTAKKE